MAKMEVISKPEDQLKLVHHLSDMDQSKTTPGGFSSSTSQMEPDAPKPHPRCAGDSRQPSRPTRKLCHMYMPVSHWKIEDFCIAPVSWKPEDWVSAVTLKATFLGSGGLVLCFAFHNAVADGRSISMFIETFAKGTRDPSAIHEIKPYMQPRDLAEACDFDFKALHHLGRCHLIKFPAKAIAELKDGYLAYCIGALDADHLYLSTIDVLSALLWVSLLRARHTYFSAAEYDKRTMFTTTVDLRPRDSEGVVPPDYFGNISMNMAVTSLTIRNIIRPETTECRGYGPARLAPDQINTIAVCADQILQALLKIQPDSIEDRLAIYMTFDKPLEASVASCRAIQSHKYGVRVGSLADLNFGIPGTGGDGRPRFVRKPWMMENGLVNILPRRRGSDDDWVVLVGADSPVLDQLCSRRELDRWASGFVDDRDPSLWWETRFGARRLPDE